MSITTRPFGQTAQGETVTQYILTNKIGATVKLINYGANLTSLTVPDREGKLAGVETIMGTKLSKEQTFFWMEEIAGYLLALAEIIQDRQKDRG